MRGGAEAILIFRKRGLVQKVIRLFHAAVIAVGVSLFPASKVQAAYALAFLTM